LTTKNIFATKKYSLGTANRQKRANMVSPGQEEQKETEDSKPALKTNKF
jgi:hypothetical protein